MNYHSTVLGQLLRFIPRDFFQKTVGNYRGDKGTRELSSWTHLAALIFAQLTGQQSVRDLETALYSRRNDLYHTGMKPVRRSTFCDANRKRSHEIFQELYYHMLGGLTHLGRRIRFRFKNPVKFFYRRSGVLNVVEYIEKDQISNGLIRKAQGVCIFDPVNPGI